VQEIVTGIPSWAPVAIGFSLGGLFIRIIDKILPHLHLELPVSDSEGPKTSLPKSKYVTNTYLLL
jgi:ZIP family zinc transporter